MTTKGRDDRMDLGGFMQNFVLNNPFKDMPGPAPRDPVQNLPVDAPNISVEQNLSPESNVSSPGSIHSNINNLHELSDGELSDGNSRLIITDKVGQVLDTPKAHVGSNVSYATALKLKQVAQPRVKVQAWLRENYCHVAHYPGIKDSKSLLTEVKEQFPHVTGIILSKVMTFTFPDCPKVTNISGCHGYRGLVAKPQDYELPVHLKRRFSSSSQLKTRHSKRKRHNMDYNKLDSPSDEENSSPQNVSVEKEGAMDLSRVSVKDEDADEAGCISSSLLRTLLKPHKRVPDPEEEDQTSNSDTGPRNSKVKAEPVDREYQDGRKKHSNNDHRHQDQTASKDSLLPIIRVKTEPADPDDDVNKNSCDDLRYQDPVEEQRTVIGTLKVSENVLESHDHDMDKPLDMSEKSSIRKLRNQLSLQEAENTRLQRLLASNKEEIVQLKTMLVRREEAMTELVHDFSMLHQQFADLTKKFMSSLASIEQDKNKMAATSGLSISSSSSSSSGKKRKSHPSKIKHNGVS